MEYKGYYSRVEYDEELEIFHGEVVNIKDVITFEGESVEELKQAFQDSVDDYLEYCAERGEDPARSYSGKFVIRTEPELHMRCASAAKSKGISLNALINELMISSLGPGIKENIKIPHSDLVREKESAYKSEKE
jgi:predicted HicB family RNase H-like nuclease